MDTYLERELNCDGYSPIRLMYSSKVCDDGSNLND